MTYELREPVVLIGPQASGKTTTGKLLAARLGVDFVDQDELFQKTYRIGIGDSLKKDPNNTRRLELELLRDSVDNVVKGPFIIGTGGGVIRPTGSRISPDLLEDLTLRCKGIIKPAHVVYLQSHEDLEQMAQINFERINQDSVNSAQRIRFGEDNDVYKGFEDMIKQRHPYYNAVANYIALGQRRGDEKQLTPEQITSNILEYLRETN